MRSRFPERIGRLEELAGNLWWSWHVYARQLFISLDYPLWRSTGHNPVQQLHDIDAFRLQEAANDSSFLALYDSVMADFDADKSARDGWVATNYPGVLHGPIAYFCTEFAIHSSLPIYAGGLGILAGDSCKEACDLGLPLVGVGFMYPQGYFRQRISAEGLQEEVYQQLNFSEAPIHPVNWAQGSESVLSIQVGDRPVYISAWHVRLGRVKLYLLDTSIEENIPQDRLLSARLYTADREQRIQQEILLGMGGVKLLRALGVDPSVWHANEGHTSFMMLERIREEVAMGVPFNDALTRVRANTIFTTHTPLPAGHDVFPYQLMDKYLNGYWDSLGIDRDTFLSLGKADGSGTDNFNMTALALRLADHRCGVSQLHGKVTRRMWQALWPELEEDKVPISYITNGVHLPTWIAHEMYELLEKYLGHNLLERYDDPQFWERIVEIPDDEFWSVRQTLRRKLVHIVVEHAQQLWAGGGATAEQVLATGALLDSDTMTLGFVRRFAEYKRAALIFSDIERLKKIITDQFRPVQIIFVGKSHPADFASKYLLQRVYNLAKDRQFQGRIAFVEDYDMHLAHYLVQGVDLWLNTPRRLQEACGTSGMKASINGIPNLSVPDGWWIEGYNGANGWIIGNHAETPDEEDGTDASSLYQLLEEKIVPLYYERDLKGVPHGWINVAKEAIRSIAPSFCTRRMLKDYISKMYVKATKIPEYDGTNQMPR
jgi:starch phosphorylase